MDQLVIDEVMQVRDRLQEDRVKGVQDAVYYCYGGAVEGDIVEFGTMTGKTARGIALAMLAVEGQYGLPPKHLWLYDSFIGLPKPDRAPDLDSPHVQLGHWASGGCQGLTMEELSAKVGEVLPKDRYSLVKGWYADTVPHIAKDQRFAMMHVDCDLYGSTMDCLVPVFENGQVSRGCVISFDDWMCNQADPQFGERKALAELIERFDMKTSPWNGYTWSGHRYIVHSYNGMPT